MVKFEFPLQWLPQQPRTKIRKIARFGKHNPSESGDHLINELIRLGAKHIVISSNLQMRQRGDGFYANQKVDEAGVVVYFNLKGKSKAMACDRWTKVEHNIWALFCSIQAIRGLERWGGSEFLDGLFTGFKALPAPDVIIQSNIIYFSDCITELDIKKKFYKLSKELHPDLGGNLNQFIEMKRQYEQRMKI